MNNVWACMSICVIKEQHFKGFLNQFSVVQIFEEHGLNHRMYFYRQLFFITSLKITILFFLLPSLMTTKGRHHMLSLQLCGPNCIYSLPTLLCFLFWFLLSHFFPLCSINHPLQIEYTSSSILNPLPRH